jgi:hypothetical protein
VSEREQHGAGFGRTPIQQKRKGQIVRASQIRWRYLQGLPIGLLRVRMPVCEIERDAASIQRGDVVRPIADQPIEDLQSFAGGAGLEAVDAEPEQQGWVTGFAPERL